MAKIETQRAKILKRMEAEGWVLARHGGEHDLYRHPERAGILSLPRHRTVSIGTARSIARGAGWLDRADPQEDQGREDG